MHTDTLAHSETSSVYLNTETARLLLGGDCPGDLASTRSAIAEAAYYLSDPIAPDDREQLLMTAEAVGERHRADTGEDRAVDALGVLSEAADEVDELLRGPGANSEIRIARKAVSRAIEGLARHLGLRPSQSGDSARAGRLAGLRRGRRERA